MKNSGVIIVGAGLGGLTAALALQRFGVPVKIYERAPDLAEVGAGISLGPNATIVLNGLGLVEPLKKICNSPDKLCNKDYLTGRALSEQDAVDYVGRYGAPYYQVHRADLMDVLVTAVRANDPEAIVLGHDFVSHEADDTGVDVSFANGTTVRGDVLIGCDGVKSVLRGRLWDPKPPEFLGYVAYRGLTPVAKLPEGLIRPASSTFNGPQRHFTRYLVRGGTLVNFVAFCERTEWTDEGWHVPANVEEVLGLFEGWNDEVRQIIANAAGGQCNKWGLFGREPLPRWTSGRVTLLGDAAHPMLPFMGQGASMAIEDGAVLARALAAISDRSAALERYEEIRRPRANEIVRASSEQGKRIHRKPTPGQDLKSGLRPDVFGYNAMKVEI